jgi:hypothetical protein
VAIGVRHKPTNAPKRLKVNRGCMVESPRHCALLQVTCSFSYIGALTNLCSVSRNNEVMLTVSGLA